ncbi:hypothetical protein [Ancylothrix sp. D3o]|nr:hypothetical protein [Ancylothrix sp. D3o]
MKPNINMVARLLRIGITKLPQEILALVAAVKTNQDIPTKIK